MVQILPEKKSRNYLALFVLLTVIMQGASVLLLLFQGAIINRLSKNPPTLVQLVDGESIRVEPMDYLERTPQTIREFVEDTMTMLMTWSGELPVESAQDEKVPRRDPGVTIATESGRSQRIATSTWQAGFALSEDFRVEFLQELTRLTPQRIFSRNQDTQVVLVILDLSEPKKIEEGKWKLAMVANLLFFRDGSSLGEGVPFNKEVYVHTVVAPEVPDDATPLARKIYQVRQAGLEIYAMRDLEAEEILE
ncbi:MAG: hypothetical protein ACFB4I_13030 [Cyanophyceae cyanobacterium]